MIEREIYRMQTPYRDDFVVKGYQFGKGQKAACIVGPVRGNEIQQLYVCSQLVKTLKELEQKGCISNNKEVLIEKKFRLQNFDLIVWEYITSNND